MQVALVGYGVENQAVYRYLAKKGVAMTICDQKADLEVPTGVQAQLGDTYLDNLDRFDQVIRSVGIHPDILLAKNPTIKPKITTAVNLFFEDCKTPIIGVTGTKGKGTTSKLIHKILEAAGKKTVLAGNIGIPMLDVLEEAAACDYVVLELSSFQLYDARQSPHIAVCLMVVPEHLNWHADLADYAHAKGNLFRYQNNTDIVVYDAFNTLSTQIASSSPATTKLTYAVPEPDAHVISLCTTYVEGDEIFCRKQPVMRIADVKLPGRHNLENVCAAIAATWDITGGNIDAIRQAITGFTGLDYRLQTVRELNGVTYVNDSFSTTPETAIAALRAFPAPKILIAGGADKGIPFDELTNVIVGSNVKTVLAIGERGPTIAKLLQARGYTNFITSGLDNMQAIVEKAHSLAEPGDVVLLSTGCASFGMFTDYKDRGDQFNEAVKSLL
jgi:UDP-N-acetylmuramoylalanine--D-glutamate ligase